MINICVSVQAISSKETNIQKLNCYLKYIYIYHSYLYRLKKRVNHITQTKEIINKSHVYIYIYNNLSYDDKSELFGR